MAYSNSGDAKEICQCRKCNGQKMQSRWAIIMHSYLYRRAEHGVGASNVMQQAARVEDLAEATEVSEGDDDHPPELMPLFETEDEEGRGHTAAQAEDPYNPPLFPNARCSLIEAILYIMELKTERHWAAADVTALLKVLHESLLPRGNCMPRSYYEAKRLIRSKHLIRQKIHACKKDCCIFYGQLQDAETCPTCGESRYEDPIRRLPWKQMSYFPIIPRIHALFQNREKAELMSWHHGSKSLDGFSRVPADCGAWKAFNDIYPWFEGDPRNLRLGLSLDGISPFSQRASPWTMWPVFLVNYNIPPWLAFKPENILLSMILPGRRQVKDVNIYLEPLVDELQTLWMGMEVEDFSQPPHRRVFDFHAMVAWTMQDLPGYGYIAACNVHGWKACPVCGPNTAARKSEDLRKFVYMDHIRFLDEMNRPRRPSGRQWRAWAFHRADWEDGRRRRRGRNEPNPTSETGVKGACALFALEYWEKLPIRHTIDVMHVVRNVCATLLDHLFGSADTDRVREDLRRMGTMNELWIQRQGHAYVKPAAPYVLSAANQRKVRDIISALKFPKGYGANLKLPFTQANFAGLKSHDYHILLQGVLPMALRGCLRQDVFDAICRLSRFFISVCTHELKISTLRDLEIEGFQMLCELERVFPPSFFNISEHLISHLVEELQLCGVVHHRWMYPSERYMRELKLNIQNRSRPEGNIGENYLLREATIHARRNFSMHTWEAMYEGTPAQILRGRGNPITFTAEVRLSAHMYVLQHIPEMEPWRRLYHTTFQSEDYNDPPFHIWVRDAVRRRPVSTRVEQFAEGCLLRARSYEKIWVDGRYLRTASSEVSKRTCNSGVVRKQSVADGGVENGELDNPGVIEGIFSLDYGMFDFTVLKVRWFDATLGTTLVRERGGFTVVDSTKFAGTGTGNREVSRFCLPEHVDQVFFSPDAVHRNWWVVMPHRERRSAPNM